MSQSTRSHSGRWQSGRLRSTRSGSGRAPSRHRSEKYILRERVVSLTGNDFDVFHAWSGKTAFSIRGDYMSLHDTKVMRDGGGTPILSMKSALFSPRGRMRIKRWDSGEPVVTLRRKSLVPMEILGGGTVRVWKGSREIGHPLFEVRGDMYGKWFSIVEGTWGDEVAFVHRKSFTISSILGRSTYVMRMQPGYDAALLVFIAVAIDEFYRE